MEILKLTEYVIEYLLISSAMLLLMGMTSFFAVNTFRVKGRIKIWVYALVFVLPIFYPMRSLLPESIKVPLGLKSEYIESLISRDYRSSSLADKSLPSDSRGSSDIIISNEKPYIEIGASDPGLNEGLIGIGSQVIKNWKPVAAAIWLLIFSFSFIRLISAMRTAKRFLRFSTPVTDLKIIRLLQQCASETGIPHAPQIFIANGISSPMVMGYFKPVIVIPAHLITRESIEGLRFALLHELKHIHQRHNLWLFMEALIGAAYFFHPVIHWAKRKIHEELENICDRHVINITHNKVTYADFLLNEIWQNSPGRYPAFSLPFITTTSKAATRIRSILENRAYSASMPARETMAVVSVLAVFSSLMFFTIVPVVQKPDISQDRLLFSAAVKSNNLTPAHRIEQINASPVLSPPANDKPVEIHQFATKRSLNSSEYAAEEPVKHFKTAPDTQVNAVADNTVPDKVLQPEIVNVEQPEQMSEANGADIELVSLTGNTITDTLAKTPQSSETTAQKYLGPPVKELTIHRIDNIKVLDQYTIIFIMRGGDMYLNSLSEPCPALLYANDFNLDSTTGKLTKFDRIQGITNNQIIGSTGMLGEFYLYKYQGSKAEAIKLLKKELLKKFISEGALNQA